MGGVYERELDELEALREEQRVRAREGDRQAERAELELLWKDAEVQAQKHEALLYDQLVEARLTIRKLSDEIATCFELLKHWHDKPHVDQSLPKFLAETLYPDGGRLVFQFVGPEFDDEEAGHCECAPGTH